MWREVEGGEGRWREMEGDGGRWREVVRGGGRWWEVVGSGGREWRSGEIGRLGGYVVKTASFHLRDPVGVDLLSERLLPHPFAPLRERSLELKLLAHRVALRRQAPIWPYSASRLASKLVRGRDVLKPSVLRPSVPPGKASRRAGEARRERAHGAGRGAVGSDGERWGAIGSDGEQWRAIGSNG